MKQTKKLTRNQREFLDHNKEFKTAAKAKKYTSSDYRCIEDNKDYLKVMDSDGKILTVTK